MSDFLPALNSSGIFKLKAPISNSVNVQVIYTCKSIRKISELNSSGIDVFLTYYSPNGLSLETYKADRANDVSIVGLYSDTASWIYVPSSQLDGYPDSSGVAYRRMGLAIDLGPMEENYNLDSIHELVSELVFSQLGVTPTINTISLSKASMVKTEDHEAIKNMRLGKVDIHKTIFLENKQYKDDLETARIKIKALEDFILSLQTQ